MIYIPAIIAFILLFLDVPVGLSLLSSALIFFGFMTNDLPLTSVVQRVVSCNMSSSLLTIPCFLMVGTVMNHCGITERLMRMCNALVGKILVPEMTKLGYPVAFSAAVTAASGLIAPMIPPGNALILYATMTDVSVVKMFMAGYIPGILMCIAEMIVVKMVCHKNHYQSRTEFAGWKEVLTSALDAMWAILIMVVLMVGVRMGLFNV